jgi:transcription elongation factor GreA
MAPRPSSGDPLLMTDRAVSLTPTEHEAYRRELEALSQRREHDLPRLLREARTYATSDAVEEAAQIREDFAFVDRRIAALRELLASAAVADAATVGVAGVGSAVTFEYLSSGRKTTCVISGIAGAAPGSLSAGSPVGQALLGGAAGDVVTVELPRGRTEQLRILQVTEPTAEAAA